MLMDIVIIGGGPGGYTAAIKAAQLGAKVLLVEKNSLGGTCLNRGCIPTKTLYRNAEILNLLKKSNEFGINVEGYNFDIEKMQERKNEIINGLREGINQLLKANKIEVMCGDAHIKNKNTVMVVGEDTQVEVETKNIIIATGSKPAVLNVEGAELDGVYTSEEMLEFSKLPKKLAVIGGGVIGMEFAGIFNSMGSKVSVIEFLSSILAPVDSDLTKRLSPMLKKGGIDIFTSTKVKKIEKKDDNLVVLAEGKKGEIEFAVDAVLMSVGRVPHTEGLNLDELGILYDRKGIKVDENYMTNINGIYAIGDVNGINMLAHAAAHQGIEVAQSILGLGEKNHKQNVPGCIFIFPEISMIGITENEAKEKGINYTTSKFLFGANGKALTLGEGEGMVKIIASKEDDKILGVHIMGPHASDLIHEGILAVNLGLSTKEVGSVIHAHPTLAEAFSEAVLGINGEAIHMIPKKK